MKKIEMIRCAVRSPHKNDNPEGRDKSVRYVPSEIFRLWRYLMESVKGFEISEVVTGAWLDQEMFLKEKNLYGARKPDPVVEVSFQYTQDTHIGRPVIRYFPQDRFDAIVKIFLKNFNSAHIQGGTRQTAGYFLPIS